MHIVRVLVALVVMPSMPSAKTHARGVPRNSFLASAAAQHAQNHGVKQKLRGEKEDLGLPRVPTPGRQLWKEGKAPLRYLTPVQGVTNPWLHPRQVGATQTFFVFIHQDSAKQTDTAWYALQHLDDKLITARLHAKPETRTM